MSARTTRASNKRTANEASPASPPTSSTGRKGAQHRKRSRNSEATLSTNSINKALHSADDLQLIESIGDIFNAPPNSLIIHACNCDGSWGAGIAKAFKDRYPKAFEAYDELCEERGEDLLDHAQLIPPVDAFESGAQAAHMDGGFDEPSSTDTDRDQKVKDAVAKHFVGCLYTSRHFGRRKDKPARILQATAPAMVDLLRRVNEWNAEVEDSEKVGEVRMCKINSGLFAVPWEKTKKVLEEINVTRSDVKVIKVISPPN